MGIELLTERLKDQIAGVLGCWDRVLIFGTLPKICYAEGMTSYLYAKQVRIFDYPKFAEPFRNRLRENAERLAADNGIEIEFLRKRKDVDARAQRCDVLPVARASGRFGESASAEAAQWRVAQRAV